MGLGLRSLSSCLNLKLGEGSREDRGMIGVSPRDGLLNPGFLELLAPEGNKELFVFLNTYGPDRHGDLIHHCTERVEITSMPCNVKAKPLHTLRDLHDLLEENLSHHPRHPRPLNS